VVQTNAKIRGPKAMSLQKKQGDGVRKRVVDGYYSKGKDGVAFVEPKVFIQIKSYLSLGYRTI